MSLKQVYQWRKEITSQLPSLSAWQGMNVALFSIGIIEAESSQQRAIARKLWPYGKRESLERRQQRYLANEGVQLDDLIPEWTAWVMRALERHEELVLLVDETKLSDHLGAMVLGLAYEGRCLPLAWRCYEVDDYPAEGQVGVIMQLVEAVAQGLPAGCRPLLLADRGIGTSPALLRALDEVGWRYLMRVTKQSKLVAPSGAEYTIYDMVDEGEVWTASGRMFKQRGQVPAHARVLWADGYEGPWALVTNDPALSGYEYAVRNWQEQSFRDLKSHGWQWDTSHVWLPAHADRLLLLLTLAYAWVLALGTLCFLTGQQARPKKTARGLYVRRFSVFSEGMNYLAHLRATHHPVCPKLFFASGKPL